MEAAAEVLNSGGAGAALVEVIGEAPAEPSTTAIKSIEGHAPSGTLPLPCRGEVALRRAGDVALGSAGDVGLSCATVDALAGSATAPAVGAGGVFRAKMGVHGNLGASTLERGLLAEPGLSCRRSISSELPRSRERSRSPAESSEPGTTAPAGTFEGLLGDLLPSCNGTFPRLEVGSAGGVGGSLLRASGGIAVVGVVDLAREHATPRASAWLQPCCRPPANLHYSRDYCTRISCMLWRRRARATSSQLLPKIVPCFLSIVRFPGKPRIMVRPTARRSVLAAGLFASIALPPVAWSSLPPSISLPGSSPADRLSRMLQGAARVKPRQLPRAKLENDLAVLLMRTSYSVADDLDFYPMDKFQQEQFLFRQDEWEKYREALPGVQQGFLTEPAYFDFISFVQYATIATTMRDARMVFDELIDANGTSIVVTRDPALADDALLPARHSARVGDAVLAWMVERYGQIRPVVPRVLTAAAVRDGVQARLRGAMPCMLCHACGAPEVPRSTAVAHLHATLLHTCMPSAFTPAGYPEHLRDQRLHAALRARAQIARRHGPHAPSRHNPGIVPA